MACTKHGFVGEAMKTLDVALQYTMKKDKYFKESLCTEGTSEHHWMLQMFVDLTCFTIKPGNKSFNFLQATQWCAPPTS